MGAQLPWVTRTTGTDMGWAAWTNYIFVDLLEDFGFALSVSDFSLLLATISWPGKLRVVDGLLGKVPGGM